MGNYIWLTRFMTVSSDGSHESLNAYRNKESALDAFEKFRKECIDYGHKVSFAELQNGELSLYCKDSFSYTLRKIEIKD